MYTLIYTVIVLLSLFGATGNSSFLLPRQTCFPYYCRQLLLLLLFYTPSSRVSFSDILVLLSSHKVVIFGFNLKSVSYTHLRAHETPEHLVCRLLLEKKKKKKDKIESYRIIINETRK
eukprot:TRINITY_DN1940_c0_g1_i13.p1 TRINITY_DN1940_c0_g1~~TRINITY_DN1940_c0_g1_i13.p1  ORF type:complete len:118 (-),score=8.01 TRINITY_DN1940_c0_g1_i13:82-435(-)